MVKVAHARAVLLLAILACPLALHADSILLKFAGAPKTPAERAYVRGVNLLGAGKLPEADAAFTESNQLNASSGIGYVGLAEIALRRGQPPRAEELLRKGLTVDPKDARIQTSWGMFLEAALRWKEAETAYRRALTLGPRSIQMQLGLANVLLKGLDRPGEAAASYRKVLELDPSNGAAYFGLGVALIKLDKGDDARSALTQAARLTPQNPVPSQTLGELYLAQNNPTAALKAFDAALAANPKFFQARISRGDIFMTRGDGGLAIAEYEAAVAAAPKAILPKVKAGMAYQALGRTREARERYMAALDLDPNQVTVLNNLAWMAAQSKTDLGRAQEWANKAAALAPNDPVVMDTLGWVQYVRGDVTAALHTLQRAVQTNPKDAGTRYHLAVVYEETGKKTEARAELRQALQLSQSFDGAEDARQRLAKYGQN